MKTTKCIGCALGILLVMAFSVSRKPVPATTRHSLFMEAKFQFHQFSGSLTGSFDQPHRSGH